MAALGGTKCSRNASEGGITIKHYGDITKLSGYELPIVDCIIGGSPCQDLSVAGKRAGLAGERSGLFMEQLRIVKEMRKQDELGNGRSGVLCRPRYMGWENVPGSFSSAGGKDFQAVLSEIVKVVEPDAPDVPLPEKGRWPKSGCIYDEMGRWSVAYRLHDAQFWGVPQRRKRIALVADFGGLSAPEILFERKGVSGDSESGKAQGEETPGDFGDGAGSRNGKEREVICQCFQNTGQGWWNESEIGATIRTLCGGDSTKANLVAAVDCRNGVEDPELNASLQSSADHNLNSNNVLRQGGIVRRLTPLECERLQGFPDGWTDIGEWTDTKGKVHKPADSPRYKALGNSIAVGYANKRSGFWMWMVKRISAQYERAATLGSLFDGIGGFPLAWETFNGKGSAVWASEIEEFAIAVTKKHFPEEDDNAAKGAGACS